VKTFDMEQGSTAWYMARCGVITASEVDALVSPTGKVRTGQGVDTYLHRKLAEKMLNWSPEMLNTFPMDQGKIIETIAIPWFEFTFNKKVSRVGFCTSNDGKIGFSPDGILEDGSGLELKAPQPPAQIRYLLGGTVPDEYAIQIQHSLLVSGAPYWTFASYSLQLPALVLRVEPDPKIQAALKEAIDAFLERMDKYLAQLAALATP
jgi:YqaJ-like viral recombinase domain